MADKPKTHEEKMQRIKAKIDARIAKATEERGIIIINTGNGKGKSSSAIGNIYRALGHGFKVGMTQFIKGEWVTGEELMLKKEENVELHIMPSGFTWETQSKEKDLEALNKVWPQTLDMLKNPELQLVVLDEVTYLAHYEYIDLDELIDALLNRPLHQSVIITGRGAPKELIEIADTVSEIKPVKHAFNAGIQAQKGIEW